MADLGVVLKRELGPVDLETLARAPRGALKQSPQLISKIRHTHHNLARLIAAGLKHEEISRITGYSPAYISTLASGDPAFKSLIEYYQTLATADFQENAASLHERLSAASMLAAERLTEKLTDEDEEFSVSELNEIIKTTADRTGFGPQSRSTVVNVNVDLAARLESARRRAWGGEADQPSKATRLPNSDRILELEANKNLPVDPAADPDQLP